MNHLRKKILRAANLLEDPDRASQQPECNDPAPPYPACLFWSQTRTARYVHEATFKWKSILAVSGVLVMGPGTNFMITNFLSGVRVILKISINKKKISKRKCKQGKK